MRDRAGRRVLIIVQNLPVPLDRRVWLECQALVYDGFGVSVICPKGTDDPSYEQLNGVHLYKYRPPRQASGFFGFAWEFLYCWLATAVLSVKVWRRHGFDTIQACNPPDTFWALALPWRIRKVRFVFDQHDLNPELFRSRFGDPRRWVHRVQYNALIWLERMTYRVADHVIVTNESYQAIAIERGRLPDSDVTIVRSGPDTSSMTPIYPDPLVRSGADHLLVYVGIMGPQDNVDQLLLVLKELVHRRGRAGIRLALLGFGDCLTDLQQQAEAMRLDQNVVFTGRVGPATIAQYLSAADVGLCPDLKSPLNDVSTMNKVMEYMSFCLPIVSYDLLESRKSAGNTGVFVPSGDVHAFADAIERLLDSPKLRVDLGLAARRRAERRLDWKEQAQAYLQVHRTVLNLSPAQTATPIPARLQSLSEPRRPDSVEDQVDLTNQEETARFIRDRCVRTPVALTRLGQRPTPGRAPVSAGPRDSTEARRPRNRPAPPRQPRPVERSGGGGG